MYEIQSISYHGGCCGDFVRLLILTGDKNVGEVEIKESGYVSLHALATDFWYEDFCKIDEVGAVRSIKALNHTADFYRRFYIDTIENIESVDDYIKIVDERYENADEGIRMVEKRWSLTYSIHTFHDHTVFLNKFKSLSEYYQYADHLGIQRTLFIHPITKKSISMFNKNKAYKNNSFWPFTESELIKEYELIKNEMREGDIFLELEDAYDKEKLRKFLADNYTWEDKNFDKVYDEYMNRQPF